MKFPCFAIVCRIVPMLVLLGAWGCRDQNGSEETKADSPQQRVAIEKLRFSEPTWEVPVVGNTPAGEMKRSILELSDNVIPLQVAASPNNFKALGIERVEPLIEEVPGFPISEELRRYVVVHYSQKLPSDMLLTHVKRHQYVRDAIEKVDIKHFRDDFPDVQNESEVLDLGYLWHLEDDVSFIPHCFQDENPNAPYYTCSDQCNGINAYNAWDRLTDQHQEVIVAVLDDGVDITHPDLQPVLWVNSGEGSTPDGEDNDDNGFIDDIHGITFLEAITVTDPTTGETCLDWAISSGQGGQICDKFFFDRKSTNPCNPSTEKQPWCDHGTPVAGLIASEHNSNDTGGEFKGLMRGSCPMCRLMAIQLGLNVDDLRFPQLARGLYYAYVNGAQVVNLSIGFQSGKLGRQLMDFFATKMIVVAAAGNGDLAFVFSYENSWFYPDEQPPYAFPASHNAVISVGNLTPNGLKAPSSHWNDAIDVFTPASPSVMSTVNTNFWSTWYNLYGESYTLLPGFFQFNGTSAASPITAGVAGMIASHYQAITDRWPAPEEVRAVLRQTADWLDGMKDVYGNSLDYEPHYGYGRVDADVALDYLEEQLTEQDERIPFVKIMDPVMDSISTGTLKVRVLYSVPKDNSNVQISLNISHENQFSSPELDSFSGGFSETFDASGLNTGVYEQVWEFEHIGVEDVDPGRYKIEVQAGDAYDATHVFLGGLHIVSPYKRCKGDDVTQNAGIFENRLSFRGYVDASFDRFEVLYRRVGDDEHDDGRFEHNDGITLIDSTDPKSCPQAEDLIKYGANRRLWTGPAKDDYDSLDSELWVHCDLLALLDLDELRQIHAAADSSDYYLTLKGYKGEGVYRDVIRVDMYFNNVFRKDNKNFYYCQLGDETPDTPNPIDDSCTYPQGDCDGTPGCEVNFSTNIHNCGECGRDCENLFSVSRLNAAGDLFGAISFSCVDGRCVVDECAEGYIDCNGDPSDGCEMFSVDGSSCEVNCQDDGWLDCNGDYRDGCETDIMNDSDNCGECGNECRESLNGIPVSCIEGECVQGDQCLDDYYDLDGNPVNGCECSIDQYSRKKSNCDLSGPKDTCDPDLCIYGGVMDDIMFWLRNPQPEIVRIPDSVLDFKLIYPIHGFEPNHVGGKQTIKTKIESCRVPQGDSVLDYCFSTEELDERANGRWFSMYLTPEQVLYETVDFSPCVTFGYQTNSTSGYWCSEQLGNSKRWGHFNDIVFHDIYGSLLYRDEIAKGFWFDIKASGTNGESSNKNFYLNATSTTSSYHLTTEMELSISGEYAHAEKLGLFLDLQPVGLKDEWVKVTLDQTFSEKEGSIPIGSATADIAIIHSDHSDDTLNVQYIENVKYNWGGEKADDVLNQNLMIGNVVDGNLHWEVDAIASENAPTGKMYPLLLGNAYAQKLILLDGYRHYSNAIAYGKEYDRDIYIYTPSTNEWSIGPEMPEERIGRSHASVAYDDMRENVYLFGGSHDDTFLKDFWKLNLIDMTWESLASLPVSTQEQGRFSAGLVYLPERNELMLSGGVSADGNKVDVWMYHIESDSWYQAIDSLQAVNGGPMLMRYNPKNKTVGIAGGNPALISQVDTLTLLETAKSGIYGDCDQDGFAEIQFGQLCAPSKDWWDSIGRYTCHEENITCATESRDADWKGSYIALGGVNAIDVDSEEDRLYVATNFGVDIVSTNIDYLPIPVGWIAGNGSVKDVKRYRERVLFLDQRGLVVAEDSSTLFPSIVATLALNDNANAMEIVGDKVFIATELGLEIINITDIDHPTSISQISTGYPATDVAVGKDTVYLAGFHLMFVGLGNSSSPGFVGTLDTGKEIENMRYYNGFLYLNEVDGYPHVYKCGQELGELLEAGSHSLPYWVQGVVGRDDRLFRAGTWAVHQRKLD